MLVNSELLIPQLRFHKVESKEALRYRIDPARCADAAISPATILLDLGTPLSDEVRHIHVGVTNDDEDMQTPTPSPAKATLREYNPSDQLSVR